MNHLNFKFYTPTLDFSIQKNDNFPFYFLELFQNFGLMLIFFFLLQIFKFGKRHIHLIVICSVYSALKMEKSVGNKNAFTKSCKIISKPKNKRHLKFVFHPLWYNFKKNLYVSLCSKQYDCTFFGLFRALWYGPPLPESGRPKGFFDECPQFGSYVQRKSLHRFGGSICSSKKCRELPLFFSHFLKGARID